MRFCSVIVLLFLANSVFSQSYQSGFDELVFYADVMSNASEGKNRLYAEGKFEELFISKLKEKNSFQETFDQLKWISKIEDSEHHFKIFTWFVEVDGDKYSHFGIIQKSDGTIVNLRDNYSNPYDIEYDILDGNNWIGAYYYDMKEYKNNGETYYLLLGYDPGNGKNKRKILEVLSFDENGNPVFGKEVFKSIDPEKRTNIKSRIVIDYSKNASATLTFDDQLNIIMFENIISVMTPEEGPTLLPDGSYKAYKQEGDYWIYKDKVFDQVSSEPPTDGSHNRQEGLFGSPKSSEKKEK